MNLDLSPTSVARHEPPLPPDKGHRQVGIENYRTLTLMLFTRMIGSDRGSSKGFEVPWVVKDEAFCFVNTFIVLNRIMILIFVVEESQ